MCTTKAPGRRVGGPPEGDPPARRRRSRDERRRPTQRDVTPAGGGTTDIGVPPLARSVTRGAAGTSRERRDVDRRGRAACRRRARAPCAAGRRTARPAGRRRRVDRAGASRRPGSSPACATRGHTLREIRQRDGGGPARLRLHRGAAAAGRRRLHARGGGARDRARARADRAHLRDDGLQRGLAGAHLRGGPAAPALRRRGAGRRPPARRPAAARARLRPGAGPDGRRRGAALPPLRPRAAHARRRARRCEMAEEMRGLSGELLPLASPIMDHVHQRFLAHFVEQDVIGHMEAELGGETLDLGRLRVAIAFADLAGYTRLTEEAGEEEAVNAVERFVEVVEHTLPDDARVIKTIGDEVMVVGSDASSLVDWAVGFQQLVRGAPVAAHRHALRRGALPRRRLLRARGQPGPPRGGARGRRRGASSRAPWSRRRDRTWCSSASAR